MSKYVVIFAVFVFSLVPAGRSHAGTPFPTDGPSLVQGGGPTSEGLIAPAPQGPLQSDESLSTSGAVYSPFVNFKAKYDAWLEMVHRTHEKEQPDWMTPVVTITPTLQQEIRTDYALTTSKGFETDTYASKGTEIIPTENTELIFGNPTWVTKDLPKGAQASGWADWSTLFKYRLLSSPSTAGNYVVTFLLSTSFATGAYDITAGHDVVSPMLGFGKGIKTPIGEFVYQATVGPAIPSDGFTKFGTPVTWNSAFQYGNRFCIAGYEVPLWPEFEVTWVSFPNGADSGQQQVYLTPGINIGRFRITEHTYFVVGAGYQFAATSDHSFGNQWLVTMRIPYF